MKHHIIYVPGLGDHKTAGQTALIQIWKLFGLSPYMLALQWRRQDGFENKLDRILNLLDEKNSEENTVSLAGVSAGASAVLAAFALRPNIHRVICIGGKINHPETLSRYTLKSNPDFSESMSRLPGALKLINAKQRSKIMSIHPTWDNVVPVQDTILDGAYEKAVPGRGHAIGIVSGIVLGAPDIAKFIKSDKHNPQ